MRGARRGVLQPRGAGGWAGRGCFSSPPGEGMRRRYLCVGRVEISLGFSHTTTCVHLGPAPGVGRVSPPFPLPPPSSSSCPLHCGACSPPAAPHMGDDYISRGPPSSSSPFSSCSRVCCGSGYGGRGEPRDPPAAPRRVGSATPMPAAPQVRPGLRGYGVLGCLRYQR